jgi:hypothetical protein
MFQPGMKHQFKSDKTQKEGDSGFEVVEHVDYPYKKEK